jgi:hypothetical protein
LVAGWAGAARARDAGRVAVALTYEIDGQADGCPSEPDVRQGVVDQLGYDPFGAVADVHHVFARVHVTSASVDGSLEWIDAKGVREGERRLSALSGDCAGLGRAMVFALVVQIQLIGQLASQVEPPPSPPPTPAVAVRPSPVTYALGVGPVLLIRAAPATTGGGRVFASARHGAASVELAAQASLAASLRRADGTGFDARVLAATVAVCGHWRPLAVCPLGTVGSLLVTGFGVDQPRSPSAFAAGVGGRAALERRLPTRIVIGAHADVLRMLTPRTISLNDLPVWATPSVNFTLGVDLALPFR